MGWACVNAAGPSCHHSTRWFLVRHVGKKNIELEQFPSWSSLFLKCNTCVKCVKSAIVCYSSCSYSWLHRKYVDCNRSATVKVLPISFFPPLTPKWRLECFESTPSWNPIFIKMTFKWIAVSAKSTVIILCKNWSWFRIWWSSLPGLKVFVKVKIEDFHKLLTVEVINLDSANRWQKPHGSFLRSYFFPLSSNFLFTLKHPSLLQTSPIAP